MVRGDVCEQRGQLILCGLGVEIDFERVVENPKISAIEIEKL